jgi:hypothetical protein
LAEHLEVCRTVREAVVRLGGATRAGPEREGPEFERS